LDVGTNVDHILVGDEWFCMGRLRRSLSRRVGTALLLLARRAIVGSVNCKKRCVLFRRPASTHTLSLSFIGAGFGLGSLGLATHSLPLVSNRIIETVL
jgi:hypothetical protein